VLESLKPYLGEPYSVTVLDEIRFNCIYCTKRGKGADVNFHFYINKSSGLFFCQRCEAKGHISFFTQDRDGCSYGRTDEGRKKSRMEALRDYFTPHAPVKDEPFATAELPDDYISIDDYPTSEAVAYLESRGISFDLAMQRGIGFGATKNRGRVVFPVFDPAKKTQCVYWVARSYTNVEHWSECDCYLCKYKYTNAPDVKRRYFIYGLEFCDDSGTICVTEGTISALNSGDNAVATFGKYVTDEQLDILSDRADRIQVALDPDAYTKSVDLMRRLLGRGLYVEWVVLPQKKDPADIGEDRMMDLRNRAVNITRSRLSRVLLNGVTGVE